MWTNITQHFTIRTDFHHGSATSLIKSQARLVYKGTRYWSDDRASIPGTGRDFSVFWLVKTRSEVCPVSYLIDTGDKSAEAWRRPLTSIYGWAYESVELGPISQYTLMAWCLRTMTTALIQYVKKSIWNIIQNGWPRHHNWDFILRRLRDVVKKWENVYSF